MKTILRITTLAALAALTTTVACDRNALEPDAEVSTLDAALGRLGSSVALPVHGRIAYTTTVDQSPEALAECPGTPGVAVGILTDGEISHLGSIRSGRFEHCSVDLSATLPPDPAPPALNDIYRVGEWELAAADGSELWGAYEVVFAPIDQGGLFTMTILGGTGRFAGASGTMEPDWTRTPLVECGDPLCLVDVVFAPVLAGEIVLPRPGR